MLYVGNDLVDIEEERPLLKHQDPRFLAKVFTTKEQHHITSSRDPHLALWSLWAAKETCFKILYKKYQYLLSFSPPAFFMQESMKSKNGIQYVMTYKHDSITVYLNHTPNYVHAYATFPSNHSTPQIFCQKLPPESPTPNLLTQEEEESIHSPASAWVRILCKQQLAAYYQLDLNKLKIIRYKEQKRFLPPLITYDDQRYPVDISLSHHGQWIAWSFIDNSDCVQNL